MVPILMGAVNLVPAQSTNHSQHKSFFFSLVFSFHTPNWPIRCHVLSLALSFPWTNLLDFDKSFFLRLIERWVNYWRDNSENFKFDMPTKSHSHCPMSSAKNRISWAQPREESFIYRHTQKKKILIFWTRLKKDHLLQITSRNKPPFLGYI